MIHVHGNNHADAIVGGVPVPTVLELALVRADAGKRFVRPRRPFPTRLDQPNNPALRRPRAGLFWFRGEAMSASDPTKPALVGGRDDGRVPCRGTLTSARVFVRVP